jgi:peptide/nickel transport system permease protein
MRTVLRKLIQLVAVLFVVTFFSFSLLHMVPGDQVTALAPFAPENRSQVPKGTRTAVLTKQDIRHEIGIDKPFLSQYRDFLKNFVRGDFGRDYSTGQKVSTAIKDALPVTLQLILYSQILALAIAIPFGILTAYKAGSWFDKIANATAFGLIAVPTFVIAFLLIYYLGVQTKVFPTQQYVKFGQDIGEHFKHMALPSVSLAVGQIAIYMRLLRSDMIQTLQEDFITMAKSKGLTNRRILLRHALRPSSFTLLTVAALNLGALIGGAVVVEFVFQLPGMGLKLIETALTKQYIALQAYVALIAIAYVAFNAIVDTLYSVLDPRIRHA